MQLGFLASHAYAIKTDPIHRGLFVLRELLCRDIPDPPPGATETPPPETDEPIETTREEISLLTGQDLCVGCHIDINAPGFAFESFDAVGAARALENDVPVDTTGELTLDGSVVTFANAGELVEALAQSSEARACYAGKWLSFAYGRRLVAGRRALTHGARRSRRRHGHRARRRHDARFLVPRSERGRPMTNSTRSPGTRKPSRAAVFSAGSAASWWACRFSKRSPRATPARKRR